jgi:hypothetical protein
MRKNFDVGVMGVVIETFIKCREQADLESVSLT